LNTRIGDGYAGWPECAPLDAIVVTAAAPAVPQPLPDPLRRAGRMAMPVCTGPGDEDLPLIRKGADGQVTRKRGLPLRFVPLSYEPR